MISKLSLLITCHDKHPHIQPIWSNPDSNQSSESLMLTNECQIEQIINLQTKAHLELNCGPYYDV